MNVSPYGPKPKPRPSKEQQLEAQLLAVSHRMDELSTRLSEIERVVKDMRFPNVAQILSREALAEVQDLGFTMPAGEIRVLEDPALKGPIYYE